MDTPRVHFKPLTKLSFALIPSLVVFVLLIRLIRRWPVCGSQIIRAILFSSRACRDTDHEARMFISPFRCRSGSKALSESQTNPAVLDVLSMSNRFHGVVNISVGASDGGKLGRQGAARGRQRAASGGGTGRQGGVTGDATFEGGGRQSNYGGGSGGRQLCVTGHRCDMLASSWRQVGAKLASRSNQGGRQLSETSIITEFSRLLAQHLFHIAHLQPPHAPSYFTTILYQERPYCCHAPSLYHDHRLQWLIALGYNYLTRPRPQLIPYFDAEGQLIGMVRLRPDPQSLRQLELRARPTEAQELSRDVSPDMPPQSHENRVSRQSHESLSWDFWPDGQFQSSVSPREITDTHKLATNWVLETVRSRGSPGALTWQKGHELRRQCSSHPSPDASEDGSENESTASWYGIYNGKQVDVSMDDMFSEAEEFEVQMDAEADENEEGVLEEEEEWEVQRDPEGSA
ncbi:hypothetical protein B0H14DRAFT_2584489 [Mycena olivaceomarginata]|nr:hypothetical protein B0H14DRAFT_2584489 [Mycena olivaceomarginata]